MVQPAQPGTWDSPLSAVDVARAATTPTWVSMGGGRVWWTQSQPERGGRQSLLSAPVDGSAPAVDVLGGDWDVRNRVHEYGGRPFALVDGRVVFTEYGDGRLYLLDETGPRALTADDGSRHSDLTAAGGELWCVRERDTGPAPTDVTRDQVAVTLDGDLRVLGASHHFLTAPQLSPDGGYAAWLGWSHPNMPWDTTDLCVAHVTDGVLGKHRVVAGGPGVSVCQLRWETEDSLLAVMDPHGWWTLCRLALDGTTTTLAGGEHELGGPLWELGRSWFAPLGRGRHAVLRGGALAVLDERSATVTDVDTDFPVVAADLHAHDGVLASRGAGPDTAWTVFTLDLSTGEHVEHTAPRRPDRRYLATPRRLLVPGDGHDIPVLLHPPTHPEHPTPERAPWLLYPHSGPTTAVTAALSLDVAFFTSRGFGVAAVDYGGSTGHGRAYRELLHGRWGVVDVADTVAVARHLLDTGAATPGLLAVRGGSAGGFTAALAAAESDLFACATLMFPILDLAPWADGLVETHDFESHYVQSLVGALPEHAQRYRDRSPAAHAHRVAGPVLVLQGAEDPVCPPEQVARFVDRLVAPHRVVTFPGERHGLRRADSIATALDTELAFYRHVFDLPANDLPASAQWAWSA